MRYVRAVEDTKRVAVEAITLSARKNVQVLASWQNSRQCGGCKSLKTNGGAEGDRTPDLRIANGAWTTIA
jgi:hypothetical protein